MNISFDPSGRPSRSLLERIVGVLLGLVALGATLFFSAVVFIILAIAGLAVWGYFWWKTRALRKQIREQMQAQSVEPPDLEPMEKGEVIEGEVIRVVDESNRLVQ